MAKEKRKPVKIEIISPKPGQIFKLKTAPIETDYISLQAKVSQEDVDITKNAKINWRLKLSWQATYKTYQTLKEISGNPEKIEYETGGTARIRASVVIDGKEYSARVKVYIIGINPNKEQLAKALDSDLLRAQAFLESTWKQFDKEGKPINNPDSSMRGLMQISERFWGEKSPLPLNDFNRISWQWDYNIKTAKLILDHYYGRAKKAFPGEKEQKTWDRALKAYKSGPNFKYKTDPSKYPYVQIIREYMRDKPWEKF